MSIPYTMADLIITPRQLHLRHRLTKPPTVALNSNCLQCPELSASKPAKEQKFEKSSVE